MSGMYLSLLNVLCNETTTCMRHERERRVRGRSKGRGGMEEGGEEGMKKGGEEEMKEGRNGGR